VRLVVLGPGHPFRGGIAATTTGLVGGLREAGHDVSFLTPVRQYPRWLYPGGDDRDPSACPRLEGAEAVLDPFAPVRWRRVAQRLRGREADAWIFPYWTWAWAPFWSWFLRLPGRPPAVAVVHNPADHGAGPLQRLAALVVLRRADALFTHGRALAADLRHRFPGTPVGHHVLPSPPVGQGRTGHHGAGDRSEAGRTVLFLGIVRRYKGLDVMLEAMARLGETTPWRLVVAGEPWEGLDRELPALADRVGVAPRVEFRFGWVPEEEVRALLDEADLVVLPYREGSQSAVAPLAMAHGVPVLATDVGGLAEMVGEGGLVVPPEDVAALAAALEQLGDADRLRTLGERAAAVARSRTWKRYAEAAAALVEQTIGGGGRT